MTINNNFKSSPERLKFIHLLYFSFSGLDLKFLFVVTGACYESGLYGDDGREGELIKILDLIDFVPAQDYNKPIFNLNCVWKEAVRFIYFKYMKSFCYDCSAFS